MLGLDDARTAIDREVTAMLALLDAGADWSRDSGLPGWSVGDLATHLVWGQSLQADGWQKALAGVPDPAQGDVVDGPQEQVRAALGSRAEAFRSVLRRAREEDLDRPYAMPYGTLPARFVLQVAVMEAGVHHRDLAAALDRPVRLAEDVTAASLWLLPFVLPSMAAGSPVRPSDGTTLRLQGDTAVVTLRADDGVWAAAPEADPACTVVGDDEAVVLAALGRRPAAELDVRGDRSLAASFKELFPGP